MTDPYEILNISSTATDEAVKKAYRELARKYHPDNYHDNPLADLAQEKMKEINAAYDAIQKERSGRSAGGYAQQQSYGGYQHQQQKTGTDPAFQRVRMAINRNDLGMAEQLLSQIGDHSGEWNYLMGTICYRRGWVDEARRYFQTACQMDPGDPEYRQTLNYVENNREGYRPEGYEVFTTNCGGNNLCARMACFYAVCMGFNTCGMRMFCC